MLMFRRPEYRVLFLLTLSIRFSCLPYHRFDHFCNVFEYTSRRFILSRRHQSHIAASTKRPFLPASLSFRTLEPDLFCKIFFDIRTPHPRLHFLPLSRSITQRFQRPQIDTSLLPTWSTLVRQHVLGKPGL